MSCPKVCCQETGWNVVSRMLLGLLRSVQFKGYLLAWLIGICGGRQPELYFVVTQPAKAELENKCALATQAVGWGIKLGQ